MTVRSQPYRLPEHKRKIIQVALQAMLEMGVIEKSPTVIGVAPSCWFASLMGQ